MLAVVALHVIPPAIFALIHGAMVYRLRGILVFLAICLIVGNSFENLGVLTGFPFGRYYFTDVMGPKLIQVPILLGLAYVGMGYLAWTLAGIITSRNILGRSTVFTVPLLAAFIMVAWDLSMDPVWSSLVHGWIWRDGGAYFGVPVSNFLGWFLTVFVIYQLFALYLRSAPAFSSNHDYSYLAVIFYGVSAAGNLLVALPSAGPSFVTDAAGVQWRVTSITHVCALMSLFTMGPYTLLAGVRLAAFKSQARE